MSSGTVDTRKDHPTTGRWGSRSGVVVLLCLASATLVACSTTPEDYKSEGEKFLQSPELAKEAGYKFSNALCEEPSTISVGTQFSCTATDNDGDDWEFVVEITGERELTVISGDLTG